MKKPELMAPAGDWTMLRTVVKHGADAVYFGLDQFNMRAKAKNFDIDDLPEMVAFCKENSVKTYVTLNTIIFEEETSQLDNILPKLKELGVDAVICWDLSIIQKCIDYGMPFCVSTQASVSNSTAANFYKKLGARRVVLARECTLEEMKKIRAGTDIEIEAFIHGAMCIALSGRCFMSHHLFGKSANRGECIQPCRRDYLITDQQIDKDMVMGEDYVLSPKDLCTIEFIDLLIESGIDSFKIEGRKRSPEYAAKTVSVYRQAIDLYFEGKLTPELKKDFLEDLKKVYNRGFSSGFYFDYPSSDDYANIYGSVASTRKEYAGKVINYFKKTGIAHIRVESGSFGLNDELLIIGTTTGVVELKPNGMMKDETAVDAVQKGNDITLKCADTVRPGDMVYKVVYVHK